MARSLDFRVSMKLSKNLAESNNFSLKGICRNYSKNMWTSFVVIFKAERTNVYFGIQYSSSVAFHWSPPTFHTSLMGATYFCCKGIMSAYRSLSQHPWGSTFPSQLVLTFPTCSLSQPASLSCLRLLVPHLFFSSFWLSHPGLNLYMASDA